MRENFVKQKKNNQLAKTSLWTSVKLQRITLAILVIVILGWAYLQLTNPLSFPIKTVKVKGNYTHISQATIQNTIKPFVHVSFFALQASTLQADLEQLPWVAKANVRRVFPATLIITITEKQPIAVWNNTALITAEGKLFSPDKNTYPSAIPFLNGPDDEEKDLLATMQKINILLEPLNLNVRQLTLSSRHSWRLILNDDIQVIIGQRDIWKRMQQLVAVFPKVVGAKAKNVVSIDLRYPNGVAVQWKRG